MTQKEYKNKSYADPSHPSFKEKKHSLIIDAQGASNKEIQTESGTLRFDNGVAVLPDDTRAKDIHDELLATEALHPNQYALVENKPTVNADPIHRMRVGWTRSYERAWDRVFGNEK